MATEVKQRNNRIIMVVLGLVLAAAAFGLSLMVSKSGNNTSSSSGQQVNVVVAKVDLPQGTELTPDVLTTKPYSVDAAPAGAVTDESTILKKFVSITVTQNTPITPNFLVTDAASAKTAALSLTPLDIHKGNVALAIPMAFTGGNNSTTTEMMSVGLYIQPEDHIDIIIDDGRGNVRYAFQDIRILKVGSYSASGNGTANVLVIEATRAEAEAITFLMDHTNIPGFPQPIKYVLRPKANATAGPTPSYLDSVPFNPPNKADNPVNKDTFNQLFPAH